MKRYFKTLIGIVLCIWVSSSAASLAQSLTLPQFDGNYAVGTKSIEVIDRSRKSTRNFEERKWGISLFYPAEDHNEQSPYLPNTITNGFIQGTQVLTHVKLNANPIATVKDICIKGLSEKSKIC